MPLCRPPATARAAALTASLLVVACSDDPLPLAPESARQIAPPARSEQAGGAETLTVGDTLRLYAPPPAPDDYATPQDAADAALPAGDGAAAPALSDGGPAAGELTPGGSRWESSDPEVATVDAAGLVTALAKGTSQVTQTDALGRAYTVTVVVRLRAEARALWVNRFEYNSPAKIVEILAAAARANFNVVYFQVRGQGDAYYRSDLEPCAVGLCGSLGNGYPPYDPLELAVREAHARGLELHAWINAFTGWASPAPAPATAYCALLRESRPGFPRHMLLEHPDWVMVSSTGTAFTCANSQAYEYAYVSPGIPGVRTHLARVAADIARRYDVDGVHLDRVRYPSQFLSYDAPSVAGFGGVRAAYDDPAWMRFRQEAVNLAVREVHDSVLAAKPRAVLSAAVWPIYDKDTFGWPSSSGLTQYLQDPRAWAAGGYFDVQVPMTYFVINEPECSYAPLPFPGAGATRYPDWRCMLNDHLRHYDAATGRHSYIGLSGAPAGVPVASVYGEIERQIAYGRARNVKGFALYSYNSAVSANLFAQLAAGAFKEPADVPLLPWKVNDGVPRLTSPVRVATAHAPGSR